MSKTVLCIENGNSCLEETKSFLRLHGCNVYALSKEQDICPLSEKLEQEEGRLDILLLGVDEQIPQDGTVNEKHDCEKLLEVLSGQINGGQEAIEAALPLLRPEGFTFRWYCAEEHSGGMTAGEYLLSGLCYDAREPYLHSDENRFVMRDACLREIAW